MRAAFPHNCRRAGASDVGHGQATPFHKMRLGHIRFLDFMNNIVGPLAKETPAGHSAHIDLFAEFTSAYKHPAIGVPSRSPGPRYRLCCRTLVDPRLGGRKHCRFRPCNYFRPAVIQAKGRRQKVKCGVAAT
jgi:hypothetical protein